MAIILASKSPRRQQLLRQLGVAFTVQVPDIDETMDPGCAPADEVARVSAKKAAAVCCAPDDVVIAADTIVVVDGCILGKPKNEADAARMLRLLSGRAHTVMTGLSVARGGVCQTRVVQTTVWFRTLSQTEIMRYIATGDPMDKAGAYGVQGLAGMFVERLEGDFFSVMGLPICTLSQMLRDCGAPVLEDEVAP